MSRWHDELESIRRIAHGLREDTQWSSDLGQDVDPRVVEIAALVERLAVLMMEDRPKPVKRPPATPPRTPR